MPDAPELRDEADGTRAPYESAQLANVAAVVRELRHPTQIGPYHVLSLVGEGGMGSVYKAEQRAPLHRVVAIKLIKLGMDTRQVTARFEGERQALAMMSHPNVAQVYDAGATEAGRPYFVMEYVAGEPITTFADRHKLTTRQRLELFSQACDAVQHAHQKAIIHRDLKPGNILVTLQDDRPLVKVIDFGVAKAISQRLTEQTMFTEAGQLIGTPAYMSPEQAEGSGLDVDTRSDVYSLGVVLYELLSGAPPFDEKTLRGAAYGEIQRIIREVDPPRPSTRLSSLARGAADEVAGRRRTRFESLEKELKGELEWVPLKAMRKDRTMRYATADELSRDIANYLQGRPLLAGPESAAYRLRKFLRRHRAGVAASAAMILLVLAGILATSWQAVRATRAERLSLQQKREAEIQREQAQQARDNAEAVNHFLTEDLLWAAAPDVAQGRPDTTVREAVDQAARSVGEAFRQRPQSEAAVRLTLAMTYQALGRSDLALPHAEEAVALRRTSLGADHPDTISAAAELGDVFASLGRFADADRVVRDAYERGRRALGADHRSTLACLGNLAYVLRLQGRYAEAEPLYREALAGSQRALGEDHFDTIGALGGLAVFLQQQGRLDDAEPLARQTMEKARAVLGPKHPRYLTSASNVAWLVRARGNGAEAEQLDREILATRREILGDDHPDTLLSMNNLAIGLREAGKPDDAIALLREVLDRRLRLIGADHPATLQSLNNLAFNLGALGRVEEAEDLFKQAVDGRRRVLGPHHPETLNSLHSLASLYERRGRHAQAEPVLAEMREPGAMAAVSAAQQAHVVARHGVCLARLGQFDRAEPLLLEGNRRLHETKQVTSNRIRDTARTLATLYDRTNRPDEETRWRGELAKLEAATRPAATAPATTSPTIPSP